MEKSFEQLMKELEVIVRELEGDQLSLEESIQKYQKGIELSKQCHDKLEEAKTVLVEKRDK